MTGRQSLSNCEVAENTSHPSSVVGELLVVPPLTAHRAPSGNLVLTQKFIDGMVEYARWWPGAVTTCVHVTEQPDNSLDHVEIDPSQIPFAVEQRPIGKQEWARRTASAALVLTRHPISNARYVLITEKLFRTHRQIATDAVSNPLVRWRRMLRTAISEWKLYRAIPHAAGVQCNGTPTYEAYRKINSNCLLFFDNRITADQLVSAQDLSRRLDRLATGSPLRLVFTGRLLYIKGADHLAKVAGELKKRGVSFEFNVCGDGELRANMERQISEMGLQNQMVLRGTLDFKSELLPYVQREADLFVCCHVQGDPSCTYVETMACGVPIVGYANEAWESMAPVSEAGWVTPLNDPEELARQIEMLDQNRERIVSASHAARAFAEKHLFEQTMRKRVEHLLGCLDSLHCEEDR